jgi:hypothetical protein
MILLVIQIVFRFIKSIEIYWNNSYIIWKELDEEILRLIYLPNINDIIYIKKKIPHSVRKNFGYPVISYNYWKFEIGFCVGF